MFGKESGEIRLQIEFGSGSDVSVRARMNLRFKVK